MKAIVHHTAGLAGVSYVDFEPPALGPNQVRVRLKAAALNHHDVWTCLLRPATAPPVVLGSDGAGIIDALGPGVSGFAEGAAVVFNASLAWMRRDQVPQGKFGIDYRLLGEHDAHGTFAEYCVISAEQLEPKPDFLTWQEAAATSLVGLTVYRALFTIGQLKAGQTVVITGIGGGAATQALLFSKAVGARVIVTSRSQSKRERALALGADLALPTESNWALAVREFTGGTGADLVIETVGKPTWSCSLACLANGGRIVAFGVHKNEKVEISILELFTRWQSICGTTMGSRDEFREMLAFVKAHRIRPVIDRSFALADGAAALRYLADGLQMGKVVLDVASCR